jgi:hypothetical protein
MMIFGRKKLSRNRVSIPTVNKEALQFVHFRVHFRRFREELADLTLVMPF